MTSPIFSNVPTRALLAGETKGSCSVVDKFEYQTKFDVNVCKIKISSYRVFTHVINEHVSSFQMTVESNYVIAVATLSDWVKRLVPVFQPMRSKSKTNRTMYA